MYNISDWQSQLLETDRLSLGYGRHLSWHLVGNSSSGALK